MAPAQSAKSAAGDNTQVLLTTSLRRLVYQQHLCETLCGPSFSCIEFHTGAAGLTESLILYLSIYCSPQVARLRELSQSMSGISFHPTHLKLNQIFRYFSCSQRSVIERCCAGLGRQLLQSAG